MRLVALLLFAGCGAVYAEQISGRVVSIADGDTFTILDANHRQYRIRLAEIDAPEKKQPFGTQSRQALAKICFQRDAVVAVLGVDRFGRTIGRVRCGGVDANAEQVHRGMAWVYDRFVTDSSLYKLQEDARRRRLGLWVDPHAIPPWEWRAQKAKR